MAPEAESVGPMTDVSSASGASTTAESAPSEPIADAIVEELEADELPSVIANATSVTIPELPSAPSPEPPAAPPVDPRPVARPGVTSAPTPPAARPAAEAATRPASEAPGQPAAAIARDVRIQPVDDGSGDRGATAPQLRRFIKSRAYVPMHELRRRFAIIGGDDDVTAVDIDRGRVYVGLPEREGKLLGELLRGGDIGVELSMDPVSPIVVGVYPMRPVSRG